MCYSRLVASPLARGHARSQARSHAYLFGVLPHEFSRKRETRGSLKEICLLHSLVFVKWFPVDDECCAPFSALASECNDPDTSVEARSCGRQQRNVFCKMKTVHLAFSKIYVLSPGAHGPWAPERQNELIVSSVFVSRRCLVMNGKFLLVISTLNASSSLKLVATP